MLWLEGSPQHEVFKGRAELGRLRTTDFRQAFSFCSDGALGSGEPVIKTTELLKTSAVKMTLSSL